MPERVAIIGAGVVGTSVAFACAAAGHPVVLVDRPDKDWTRVRSTLRRHQRRARLGTPARPPVAVDAIATSVSLSDVKGAAIVIENVDEVWEVKQGVYRALCDLKLGRTPIAANTSAVSIDRLAGLVPDPGVVVGVHFMNPADRINTVEVVRGPRTAVATLDAALALLSGMGKTAVVVNDAPGFVINRILMVMINQAAKIVAEGVAAPVQVDALFRGCLGHAMGPLRTADLIGIDTIVNTLRVLGSDGGDPIYAPAAPLLERVERGHLGMKSGQGFYRYED